MATKQKEAPKPIAIFFNLEGDQAKRFLKYKEESFLRSTAEAARKLMLERLSQLENQTEAIGVS